MASGISHILIAEKSTEQLDIDTLKHYLNLNIEFYMLGSVAPDLPYMSIADSSILENEEFLADYFHYQHTNEIVNVGMDWIKENHLGFSGEQNAACFSFLMGYASHVIVDGVVHPFVRDKVGDYNDGNKTDHRILEMKIDVFLLKEIYGTELNYSNFHDRIGTYVDNEHHKEVFSFFSKLIHHVYGQLPKLIEKRGQVNPKKVESWVKALHRVLSVAEGDYPAFYRELIGKKGFGYFDIDDIKNAKESILTLTLPIDKDRHSLEDNFLHEGREIHFLREIYPKCLDQVTSFWAKAYSYIYEKDSKPSFPAINLDNGRLLESDVLSEVPYYWRS